MFSQVCEPRLGGGNHFTIKVKSHLAVLYGLLERRDGGATDRAVLQRRLSLCREVVSYMWRLDPEQTRKLGMFMMELNRPALLLSKLDFDEGRLGRAEYLGRLKELAKSEKRAKTVLGYYDEKFDKDSAYQVGGRAYAISPYVIKPIARIFTLPFPFQLANLSYPGDEK